MLPRITGEVRCVSEPKLTFAQSGLAVASFRAVADKKKKNEATGEWEDDKIIWMRVTAFRQIAEHVAESVEKGTLLNISGTVSVSEWETDEGEKRSTVEVVADEVGVSLRYGTVKYNKAERTTGGAQKADNPWESAPASQQSDIPPF